MAQGGGLRKNVLEARRRLAELRETVAAAHARGLSGVRVAERLSAGIDEVVRPLFDAALAGFDESLAVRDHVALVAHGGNGRRQVAPYSDLDLMILHDGRARTAAEELARRFTQDVFDANLKLGQSLRTLADVVELVRDDAKTCTSLIETRLVAGSQSLYNGFRDRFDKTIKRRTRAVIAGVIEERAVERAQYGETNYLLEPNVKRSRGGLRDLHLLRWLAYIRHGTADWDRLRAAGGLGKLDHHRLHTAQEFLLRLRNELHFHAKTAVDTLSRPEQQRISELFGFRNKGGLYAVERFMKEYFWNTTQVWNVAERFIASSTPSRMPRILQPVVSHIVEEDFRVGPREVSATPQGAAKLQKNLIDVMRIVELANREGKRIAAPTWSEMSLAVPHMDKQIPREAYDRFLAFMQSPQRLGPLLRRLLELGALERLIPAFRHARCLLQANNLHKFTVDEHCIYSVQCATELRLVSGPLSEAYSQIQDKLVLHLALLLHDLGKGYEEDHSLVGGRIALETTERLGLSADDRETIAWLVRRHLSLSRAALWRDPNDPQNVANFLDLIPSFEHLRMLYVLTCCDMQAVGPGVLTDWKLDVLTSFYRKVAAQMNGDEGGREVETAAEARQQILRKAAEAGTPAERVADQLAALPDSHLARRPPEDVAASLARWASLNEGSVDAAARYREETKSIEFTVAVDCGVGSGAFAKLAGTLSGQGLQILSAELSGQESGLLVIVFETANGQSSGEPDHEQIDRVCRELRESVHRDGPPKLRRLWGDADASRQAALSTLAHRVEFENAVSRQTIVEVYTFDRRGLLYSIAQRIHDLGLTIHAARIATYLDQVVDVFYVTDRQGQKVVDSERLSNIRSSLLEVVSREE